MATLLVRNGFELVHTPGEADLMILNTCNVKTPTEQRMVYRASVLAFLDKPLIIAGCMAMTQPGVLRPHARALIGPKSVDMIVEAARAVLNGQGGLEYIGDGQAEKPLFRGLSFSKVSAVLPIEEGCLGRCAYCITKFARGELSSRRPGDVIRAIETAVSEGFREIYLTGQDLGVYGWDIGTNLANLLSEIRAIRGAYRVRVGMMNPGGATKMLDSLLDAYSDPRMYKFFHMPVQTGSDRLLHLMLRGHSVRHFEDAVGLIRERYPLSTIATDVIVGLPTESEEDFEETMRLIERIKPEVINLSKFGARPGTPAADMPQLPRDVIKRRSRIMSELCLNVKKERNEELIGRELPVLVTESTSMGFQARTDFYRPVAIKAGAELGEFCTVEVVEARSNYVVGRLLEKLDLDDALEQARVR